MDEYSIAKLLIPTFETNRLILKPVSLEDAPNWQKHFNDYEVIRHLSSRVPWPYPENGSETFIRDFIIPNQNKDRWCWGLFLKTNPDELIGSIELWRKPTPENRGFWLGKKFWGQGLMTEAVEPITRYAFTSLGFTELFLTNALGNDRSRRIKEKAGAELIEIRESSFVDKSYNKTELWKLTKEKYKL